MYPTIFNENNEAIKVPNMYADYISSQGYKKATGMDKRKQGGWLDSYGNGGDVESGKKKGNPISDWWYNTEDVQGTYKMYNELDPFLSNWMSHPETIKRTKNEDVYILPDYIDSSRKQGLKNLTTLPIYNRKAVRNSGISMSDIEYNNELQGFKTPRTLHNPYYRGSGDSGVYYPKYHVSMVDSFADKGTIAHEGTHATTLWQDDNELALEKGWGKELSDSYKNRLEDYRKNYPSLYNSEMKTLEYLQEDGLYPRIMDIRRELNVKPGQIIDKELLKKNTKKISAPMLDLEKFYNEDTIIDILNTIADSGESNDITYAKNGGWLDTYEDGGKIDGDDKKPSWLVDLDTSTQSLGSEDRGSITPPTEKPRFETKEEEFVRKNKELMKANTPSAGTATPMVGVDDPIFNAMLAGAPSMGGKLGSSLLSEATMGATDVGKLTYQVGKAGYKGAKKAVDSGSQAYKDYLSKPLKPELEPYLTKKAIPKGKDTKIMDSFKDKPSPDYVDAYVPFPEIEKTIADKVTAGANSIYKAIPPVPQSIKNRTATIKKELPTVAKKFDKKYQAAAKKELEESNKWISDWYNNPVSQKKLSDKAREFEKLQHNKLDDLSMEMRSLEKKYGSQAAYLSSKEYKELRNKSIDIYKNINNNPYNELFTRIDEGEHVINFPSTKQKISNFIKGVPEPLKGAKGLSGYSLDKTIDPTGLKRVNIVDKYGPLGDISSTGVHEGTHGLTDGTRLVKQEKDLLQQSFDLSKVKPRDNMKYNKAGKGYGFGYKNKESYLLADTEIHARINQIRQEFKLTPSDNVTPKLAEEIIEMGKEGMLKVEPRFFKLVKDPKKFAETMNKAMGITGVATAGALGATQENKNGGWIDEL
jgi:hypothetical protein